MVYLAHDLDVLHIRDIAKVLRAQAYQGSSADPRTRCADHGDRVSRRRHRRAAEAEVHRRRSSSGPRQHLVVGVGGQLERQRADEGPPIVFSRPLGRQRGHAKPLVRLDLQRSLAGAGFVRQAERLALGAVSVCRGAALGRSGLQDLRREEVQRRQRNTTVLSDIGGRHLIGHTRHQQVGVIGQGHQRGVLLRHDVSNVFDGSRDCADWVLQHPGEVLVAEQFLPIPSIRHRNKTRRLDVRPHLRRHCCSHAYIVTAAEQFRADGDSGLDIAPAAIGRHDDLHGRKPNLR